MATWQTHNSQLANFDVASFARVSVSFARFEVAQEDQPSRVSPPRCQKWNYGGAIVNVEKCAVYDSAVAMRIEDKIRDLKIRSLGMGTNIGKKVVYAGGGAGPGFENSGEFEPPAFDEVMKRGVVIPGER